MKKMNVLLSLLILGTTHAFAGVQGHGVERILPADASNVKIASVTLGSIDVGQVPAWPGAENSNDGPVYNTIYAPALDVKVTYTSADHSDDETALSNGNDPYEEVIGGPAVFFSLQITPAQAKAIKSRALDPTTLVAATVATKTVTFDEPAYSSSCRFSADYNEPTNADTCIIHTRKSETRPVLIVDLN